jgi:hypothetical protein
MADVGATAKIPAARKAKDACADVRAALDRGDLIATSTWTMAD